MGMATAVAAVVRDQLHTPVPREPVERDSHQTRFWSLYIALGFGVLAGESAAGLCYFALLPTAEHRVALIIVAIAALLVGLGLLPVASRIAKCWWRERFVLVMVVVASLTTTACCALNGAVYSPLASLLVLPVAFSAIALPTLSVLGSGTLSLAELGFLLAIEPAANLHAKLSIRCGLIVGVFVIATVSSMGRNRLNKEDERIRLELERRSQIDETTGCLNSSAFFSRLQSEVDRALRYGEPLCLAIADVDLFKSFNDTHGHASGDEVLATIGESLRSTSRLSDVVARIGGDEFAVIMPSTALTGGRQMAERWRSDVRQRSELGVSISVGVATLRRQEPTSRGLFREADAGLYLAKANGRDRVAVASEAPSTSGPRTPFRAEDRQLLEERLRQAARQQREMAALIDALETVAPVGMCVVDPTYRVLRINKTLADIAGIPGALQIGRRVEELVPGLWPQLEPLYDRVRNNGDTVTHDVLAPSSSQWGRYWLTTLYPVRVEGRTSAIGVVAVDVTDRKEAEAARSHLLRNVIDALSLVAESKDPYTAGHQRRVAEFAVAIAGELGLDQATIDAIDLAARVHDIGKIRVPGEILVRPGRLSDAEMNLVKEHAQMGHDILAGAGCPVSICQMVLQHHERLDGSGYPNALQQAEILFGARIIAVADVFDAMGSARPYRAAKGHGRALEELSSGAGRLYDGDVVSACISIFRRSRLSTRATIDTDTDTNGQSLVPCSW